MSSKDPDQIPIFQNPIAELLMKRRSGRSITGTQEVVRAMRSLRTKLGEQVKKRYCFRAFRTAEEMSEIYKVARMHAYPQRTLKQLKKAANDGITRLGKGCSYYAKTHMQKFQGRRKRK